MRELVAHDLDTNAIVLEVTESAVMERPQIAIELLRRLAAMGLHIAIDDFGTGHSSMAYVQLLPATELKIDRSFITDVVRNRNDEIIVRSTIELAHNLGMKVTAEGVEDADTVRLLTDLKCDFAQGWHYAKALPTDELIEFARYRNRGGLEHSERKVRLIR
jgi:EAL domain-containing protein (putative c-di-GMP-specific phosphodiesterase class I)